MRLNCSRRWSGCNRRNQNAPATALAPWPRRSSRQAPIRSALSPRHSSTPSINQKLNTNSAQLLVEPGPAGDRPGLRRGVHGVPARRPGFHRPEGRPVGGAREEWVQEVFARFSPAGRTFRGECSTKTYLLAIAANVVRKAWSRRTIPMELRESLSA